MGQIKKLHMAESELLERAGLFYMDRFVDLRLRVNSTLDLMRKAEFRLNDWLVCNTDKTFGEQPDVEAARGHLIEAIELLENNHDTQGRGSRQLRTDEDRSHPCPSTGDELPAQ